MKKVIVLILALMMVLSLAACGGGSQTANTPAATAEPTPEPLNEDELMAVDAIKFLSKQLVMPDGLEVKRIRKADAILYDIFKVTFSAKNNYGGVIDTSCFFAYDSDTKAFTKLYQAEIEAAESKAKLGTYQNAQKMFESGNIQGIESDDTTIYNKEAYFLKASESEGKTFDICAENAVEIDVERVMRELY